MTTEVRVPQLPESVAADCPERTVGCQEDGMGESAGDLDDIRGYLDRDGAISHYDGLDEIQNRFGEWVIDAHLPPAGTPTQPVEAGYMANAWMRLRHPSRAHRSGHDITALPASGARGMTRGMT